MDALIVMQVVGLVIGAAILGVMVYWTRVLSRALQLGREAVEAAQAARERQFRALTMPYLIADFSAAADRKLRVVVSNPSALPAFDVSLLIVARYDEAQTPFVPFVQTYVKEDAAGRWLEAAGPASGDGAAGDAGGGFGVACERHHPMIPPRRRVEYVMDLPVPPSSIYALTQHENVGGMTFGRLWHFEAALTADGLPAGGYGLADRRPNEVLPGERVTFHVQDGHYAVAGDAPPPFLRETRFLSLLHRAIPHRHLKREHLVFASPLHWTDL